MILINKQKAPLELDNVKAEAEKLGLSDKEAYNMLRNPLKAEVRESLIREQGHLCAYCMRRIPDERISDCDNDLSSVYIEHWHAISTDENNGDNKSLDYGNMLAVCSGNEKAPGATGRHKRRHFTCDKKRGNAELKINPLELSTLQTLYYTEDGRIKSDDDVINNDIDIKLNLNCETEAVTLPQNRKAVLNMIQSEVMENIEHGADPFQTCKEQLHIWENETDPKTPYIGIALWWLNDMLKNLEK